MIQSRMLNKPCSDHLGNLYGSIKDMCAYWHIRPETFSRRITKYKMTLEEALTLPVKGNGGIKCYDHLGQEFYSEAEMCQYWNVNRSVYRYRISHNWAQNIALTTPARTSKKENPSE